MSTSEELTLAEVDCYPNASFSFTNNPIRPKVY
jgi:hypothetical protein